MKPLQVSSDILAIGDFKARASQVIRQLRDSQRPIVITQNGKPAAVLITPEAYDRFTAHQLFTRAVNQGLDDVAAGRVMDDEDLTAVLDREFGPLSK